MKELCSERVSGYNCFKILAYLEVLVQISFEGGLYNDNYDCVVELDLNFSNFGHEGSNK